MINIPLQNDHVRHHNRLVVYQVLKKHYQEKLSRADLSRSTNLSVPTVNTILQEFSRLRLVEDVGQSSTRGGRPAQLVRFFPDAYHILSVDLAQTHFRAALVNLVGSTVARFKGPKRAAKSDAGLFAWLQGLLNELSTKHALKHLALSVPGVVEPGNGHVHLAPALGWNDYPLVDHAKTAFGYDVTLENDVNALAMAELHYGQGSDCTNVIYLSITTGIGLSIVIDRQIYRGSHSAAGEIGYSTLDHIAFPSQQNAQLERSGPLELHLLDLRRIFQGELGSEVMSSEAQQAFTHFCKDLTLILQNAVCLLNPERLVISWPDDTEHLLRRYIEQHLTTPLPVQVTSAALGIEGALLGVARLALETVEGRLCSTQEVEHLLQNADALPQ